MFLSMFAAQQARPWNGRAHGIIAGVAFDALPQQWKEKLDRYRVTDQASRTDGDRRYSPMFHVYYVETGSGGGQTACVKLVSQIRDAINAEDYGAASELLGALAHLSSDFAQPFHTDRDGATTKNPNHGAMDTYSGDYFDQHPPSGVRFVQGKNMEAVIDNIARTAHDRFDGVSAGSFQSKMSSFGTQAVSAAYSAMMMALPGQNGTGSAAAEAGGGLDDSEQAVVAAAQKEFGGMTVAQLVQRGNQCLAQKKYQDAVRAFEEATRQDPRNARAYHGLGNAYYFIGYKKQALNAYEQSLEINPNNQSLKKFVSRLAGDSAVR